jgi:hypothetical protein
MAGRGGSCPDGQERPGYARWQLTEENENIQMSKSKEHIHLRFQAVVIASQLPDNTAEALLVLDYARDLVAESLDVSSGLSDNVTASQIAMLSRSRCRT